MQVPYAFVVEVNLPLPMALDSLRKALVAERMGVVSEVDVQAALGPNTPAHVLLGICSPRMAHDLIGEEPDIGALLPCGCGVVEHEPGHTRIALQDPRVIAALAANPALRSACELARAALRRVADRLAATC